jgi:hypothetical protein
LRSPLHESRTIDALEQDAMLTMPIDGPEVLDRLWSYFTKCGDTTAVHRIVSVLDWEDIVRARLQTWLAKTRPEMWAEAAYRKYQQTLIRCSFPIDYEKRVVDGPVDLDLHVALLARSGELTFEELPVHLSPQDIMHLAMKSAALWSLRSVAERNPVVARLCHEESKKLGGAARVHLANCKARE